MPAQPSAHRADPEAPRPGARTSRATRLARFNAADPDAAAGVLLRCCASPRWGRRLLAHRPYPTVDALLAAADEAAYDLGPADLVWALTQESLALPPGTGRGAAYTALSAAHAAYRSRFGHAFVVCLDAVAPREALNHVLTQIRARLGNDPEEERVVAADELRLLARGRLSRLLRDAPGLPAPLAGACVPLQPAAADRDGPTGSPYASV
ncbi:2-oxo-4-hydroxy-4-carboxy-5-ureidoimidazoline decarboxylase [Streptomyces sp. NPDC050560]|uniref:2-oxo-4-hydroxy-4-carboxy-5-ureidoimidazoline decarboxylase n=1 Tax=Streptomyces sp. NPDC050560 TaxID=3365630 RepID=UPI0037881A04